MKHIEKMRRNILKENSVKRLTKIECARSFFLKKTNFLIMLRQLFHLLREIVQSCATKSDSP